MPFQRFGLAPDLLRAIAAAGYARPTPVQEAAIPRAMRGEDLIAIAQTGTGKTAAFLLPLLHRLAAAGRPVARGETRSLVLAPTRELALQIADQARIYGRYHQPRVAVIHGGVEEAGQLRLLGRGCDLVVATPGRLIDLLDHRPLDFSQLSILVLDEADRMLDMGFLPDIENILGRLPKRRQTMMLSATFPKEVESLARRFMYQPKLVQVSDRASPADTVDQSVYEVPAHLKGELLVALVRQPEWPRVLVFVRMKDGANRLAEFLKKSGVKAERLHSGRDQDQRNEALRRFRAGEAQVLVATDLAARGIDIEGVSHVVNYDFPVNPEDYIHRIGRTGRAELRGEALSFVPRHDLNLLEHLELVIRRRLPRKRLRGFNYQAAPAAPDPAAAPEKRDWRKRTRERETGPGHPPAGKSKGKPPRPPAKSPHPPAKGGKPVKPGKAAKSSGPPAKSAPPAKRPPRAGKPPFKQDRPR